MRRTCIRRAAGLGLVVACCGVVAMPLGAQGASLTDPAPGSRVRVRLAQSPGATPATRDRWTGDLVRLDADSVVIRADDGIVALSRPQVRSLEAYVGPRPLGSAMWRGAMIGAGVGVVLGAVSGAASYEPCGPADFLCPSRGGSVALGAFTVGVAGLVAGGVAGAVLRRDRWRNVPLSAGARVSLATTPLGAGVAIRF